MKRHGDETATQPEPKKARVFEFKKHPLRKVAFEVAYFGWEFDGLVRQSTTTQTVEEKFMEALLKTKLIEDWESCDFTRCGRTDKGVSSSAQVLSCFVRASDPSAEGVFWPDEADEETRANFKAGAELPYQKMLNGCLPVAVRVLRWAPVEKTFNARYSCVRRAYKYTFPSLGLDIAAIQKAATFLVGTHDYRNFCQIDMNKKRLAQSYVREIFSVTVTQKNITLVPYVELSVIGSGFLWHMIRYIVSILHAIGRGDEQPEIVSELLDIAAHPRRPQYNLAASTPLCLTECSYDDDLKWQQDDASVGKIITDFQKELSELMSKANVIEEFLSRVQKQGQPSDESYKGFYEHTMAHPTPKKYVPVLKRPTCESIEEKREKLQAKEQDA